MKKLFAAMCSITFALGCLMALCGNALAEEFPIYNVEVDCERSVADRRACIMREQQDYDLARSIWATIKDATQRDCIQMSDKPSPRHYGVLAACLAQLGQRDQLLERLKQSDHFHY